MVNRETDVIVEIMEDWINDVEIKAVKVKAKGAYNVINNSCISLNRRIVDRRDKDILRRQDWRGKLASKRG